MLKYLIIQYCKGLIRSTKFDANLIIKILVLLSSFYLCSLIFIFGRDFEVILHRFRPLADPIDFINGLLFYIFPIGCLILFFFQKNNLNLAIPYMHLPIGRSKISQYIFVIKLFNIFNICFLVFVIPFSWVNVLSEYGWVSFTLYLLSLLFITGIINYFTYLIKALSYYYFLFNLIPLLWVSLVIVLKFLYKMDPETFTVDLFDDILFRNWEIIISVALLTSLMSLIYFYLQRQFYYNLYAANGKNKLMIQIPKHTLSGKYLSAFILFEIYLLFRNRRIRSLLIIPLYFILVTYVIFVLRQIDNFYILFFWYLCLSGIWGYSYLQIVFSMESSFFDFISAANVDFIKYLKSKYFLIVIISTLVIIATLPIVILREHNFHIIVSSLLYNISIGYFIVFSTGTLNREKIDLNSGILFNYQGNNPIQIISISISILVPLALVGIFTLFLNQTFSLIIINIISLISLINYKAWFRFINWQFSIRKFTNLEGYRK